MSLKDIVIFIGGGFSLDMSIYFYSERLALVNIKMSANFEMPPYFKVHVYFG